MRGCDTRYKITTELNGATPSTGSITCYDGTVTYRKDPLENQFVEIADCHNKARLHRAVHDSAYDWLEKLDKLIGALQDYREHISANVKEINKRLENK